MMNTFMIVRSSLAQHAKQVVRSSLVGRQTPKSFQLILTRFHQSTVMQERALFSNDFFFRQLFDEVSCTYTYLLGDVESKEAILIDPGWRLHVALYSLKLSLFYFLLQS